MKFGRPSKNKPSHDVMQDKPSVKNLFIRLDKELHDQLKTLSVAHGSLKKYVTHILEEHIKKEKNKN